MLTPLATEDLKHAHIGGSVSVLGASVDPALVERVFARLCELHKTISAEPGQRLELEHAITRQLEALFHSFRPNLAIEALLPQLSGEVDETALVVVSHLFGRSGEKTETATVGPSQVAKSCQALVVQCQRKVSSPSDLIREAEWLWSAEDNKVPSLCLQSPKQSSRHYTVLVFARLEAKSSAVCGT
ncbi:MAG: hypothetical protein DMG86_20165 [Acidobacteria bacterium]|nr:MAG: hypothetical protein DMG86_20165 [Acidobacteriota bacterium]